MTTTELIILLNKLEYGASGRAREITFYNKKGKKLGCNVKLISTGDGCAGAEIDLMIYKEK
jgi:hypothetical protein